MTVEQVASEDEYRPFHEWYLEAVNAAAQSMRDDEDAGQLIREIVEGLDEAEARNVLQVIIATTAYGIVEREAETAPESHEAPLGTSPLGAR